ncbi:MAG: hypothetical protein ACREPM_03910, partial [Gemmatimonadaceae bacterium]
MPERDTIVVSSVTDGNSYVAHQAVADNGTTSAPPRPRVRDATGGATGGVTGGPAHSARDVEATLGIDRGGRAGARLPRLLVRWGIPVAIAIGAGVYFKFHHTAVPVQYTSADVRRGDITATVTATGTLAALDTVDVGTEVSGVVDIVAADYNDHVSKGETLAVVNTDQLQAQIRQGEAALQAAEATVQQTVATLAETQPQATRAESLFANRMIAQQDV